MHQPYLPRFMAGGEEHEDGVKTCVEDMRRYFSSDLGPQKRGGG